MSRLSVRGLTTLVTITCLVGCEAAKSANPTAPSVAGPIPGVNITAPILLEPLAGSTLVFTGQPQTLLIENAGSSGVRTLFLELQVSTDQGFQRIVYQADRISLGSNGRTTHVLTSPLGAGYSYYWRTRAVDGANTGPYSATASFRVVPPTVIDPPIAVSPSGKLNTNRPEFRVTNGTISGTTGVAYRFDLSTNANFSSLVAIVTVPVNGSGSTTMTVGELPYNTTYYWRVRGSDGATESNYSNTLSFTTAESSGAARAHAWRWRPHCRRAARPRRSSTGRWGCSELRPEHCAGGGARLPGRTRQLLPGAGRQLAAHGPGGGCPADLRHTVGLQRQAGQRQRPVARRGRV